MSSGSWYGGRVGVVGSLLDKLTLLTLDNSLSAFLLWLHNYSYIPKYITLITVVEGLKVN